MLYYEEKVVIDDYGNTDVIITDEDGNEVTTFEEGDQLWLLDMPFDRVDGQRFVHATGYAIYTEQWGWQDEYEDPEDEEEE